jgi:hypothetical protein
MPSRGKTISRIQTMQRILRFGFVAGGLCGLWILAACSGAPSVPAPGSGTSSSPSGGMTLSTPEKGPAGDLPASTPTVDALGIYPPPGDATEGTAVPKAIPDATGTNAVYLPAIINEKPTQYPFEVQQTGVIAIQGFSGCNWTGIAGQVFDQTESPIQNLILHLEGFWGGKTVELEALSGSASQYGPAGYEFKLGDQPLDSTQALWIQVRDAANKEISARVYLNTYNDCARNLILVNFVQVR